MTLICTLLNLYIWPCIALWMKIITYHNTIVIHLFGWVTQPEHCQMIKQLLSIYEAFIPIPTKETILKALLYEFVFFMSTHKKEGCR